MTNEFSTIFFLFEGEAEVAAVEAVVAAVEDAVATKEATEATEATAA